MDKNLKNIIKNFSKRTGISSPFVKNELPILDRMIALEEWLDHISRGEHGKIDDDICLLKKQRKTDRKKFFRLAKENY